jgi:hypothetical protein
MANGDQEPTEPPATWENIVVGTGLVGWSLSVDSTIARAHQHATNTTRHGRGWIELHESETRAA